MTKALDIQNFGCRLNALDGDHIHQAAHQAGLEDATIINSCAVTAEAVRQARQAVRKAARDNPERPVFVTGCAAQTDAETFAAMPEVVQVLGNEEKLQPASYKTDTPPGAGITDIQVSDIMQLEQAIPRNTMPPQKRARAFVQVQTGCDHRCTFCIIPFGRGNSRSTPVAEIIRNCHELVEQGHREIVLTGVDITSWGPDIGESGLDVLVRAILDQVPDLPRLRLSSVDAVELEPGLLDVVVAEPRLMPHLHLSLQAGDDMILKRMKRRHSRDEAIAFCEAMRRRRPDIVFGADIIAGFPTETDAMFDNSLRLVEACQLVWLHVFPYSQRPGTAAQRMPQVDGAVIKQRAAALRAEGDRIRQGWLESQTDTVQNVLVERADRGRTGTFAQVILSQPQALGSLVDVTITGHDGRMLTGELI